MNELVEVLTGTPRGYNGLLSDTGSSVAELLTVSLILKLVAKHPRARIKSVSNSINVGA